MCDDVIHPGLADDHRLDRNTLCQFVNGTAAISIDLSARSATEKNPVVKTADGTCDAALFYPSARGHWPAILVSPDIMGPRLVYRDLGRRLTARGMPGGQTYDAAQAACAQTMPVPLCTAALA